MMNVNDRFDSHWNAIRKNADLDPCQARMIDMESVTCDILKANEERKDMNHQYNQESNSKPMKGIGVIDGIVMTRTQILTEIKALKEEVEFLDKQSKIKKDNERKE